MKHKLILEGMMQATCSCGQWRYVGIMAEASKAIEKVHSYHAGFDVRVKKAVKERKKGKIVFPKKKKKR